jgi:hypothetical protein
MANHPGEVATGYFRAVFSPQSRYTFTKFRAHIGTKNTAIPPKSRARPTALGVDSEKVGQLQTNNYNGSSDSALLALPALLKKQGVGLEQENYDAKIKWIFQIAE